MVYFLVTQLGGGVCVRLIVYSIFTVAAVFRLVQRNKTYVQSINIWHKRINMQLSSLGRRYLVQQKRCGAKEHLCSAIQCMEAEALVVYP